MAYVIAGLAGLLFGAADQYLGSRSALGGWAAAVSGLSAPWLVLPFVAGMTQQRVARAMIVGLVATLSALVGYIAMTYSPLENVPLDRFVPGVVAMTTTGYNPVWIVGGLLTGPLYGYLGQRWRVERSWVSALLVTLALTMEPVAREAVGMLPSEPLVWATEVAIGAFAAIAFMSAIVVTRRSRRVTNAAR
jgi:hypothetical protein